MKKVTHLLLLVFIAQMMITSCSVNRHRNFSKFEKSFLSRSNEKSKTYESFNKNETASNKVISSDTKKNEKVASIPVNNNEDVYINETENVATTTEHLESKNATVQKENIKKELSENVVEKNVINRNPTQETNRKIGSYTSSDGDIMNLLLIALLIALIILVLSLIPGWLGNLIFTVLLIFIILLLLRYFGII